MNANTQSATLPVDIINKILSMSSIQQDKMYTPSYSSKSGRLHWRFNIQSTKLLKIAKLFVSPQRRVSFGQVCIHNIVHQCKTVTFRNIEGNDVEYIEVWNQHNPHINTYLHLKYTRFNEDGFNMFFTGYIYDIPRSVGGENTNKMMKMNVVHLSYLTHDGIKHFILPSPDAGSWYYNPQLHLMEFVVDFGEFDGLSDIDEGDDGYIMDGDIDNTPEWASQSLEDIQFTWENSQIIEMSE